MRYFLQSRPDRISSEMIKLSAGKLTVNVFQRITEALDMLC